ncbi:hypothetical protein JTB14_009930 [Gonioctena quinquepunctata]|nr:hypothetical protein JTB14_009930 [Gonioctena quinquepunctata]
MHTLNVENVFKSKPKHRSVVSIKNPRKVSNNSASDSQPGPSRSGTLDKPKTSGNPSKSKQNQAGISGSLEKPRQTLERSQNNSNKSSRSSRQSNGSAKSTSDEKVPQESKETGTRSNPGSSKRSSGSSFKSFLKSPFNKEKTPEPPPVRPERKKDKRPPKLSTERQLSYTDCLSVNRERTEIPRSDIINTRSDQVQDTKSEKPVKREKSPVFRFFRAQSSSPRTLGRDRTAFDFDVLFRQDPSPGRLSVNSVLRRPCAGSDSNLASHQASEKSPTKKRVFFNSLRAKRAPETGIEMAGNESSPLRDLIHPAYNEHLKSHNAVTFKLVRTGSLALISTE